MYQYQIGLDIAADDVPFNDLPLNLPDYVWEWLPKNAEYIKNCMIFSGYQTIDAIIQLENEEEVKRMFEFVVMMKEGVEDQEKMFGIFANKPENIIILPGLKPVFEKFIQGVKKLKNPNAKIKAKNKVAFKATKKVVREKKAIELPTLGSLNHQMRCWMKKQSIDKTFLIHCTENPSSFLFTCEHCKWKGHIVTKSEGKVCLSNVQRHYRFDRCDKNHMKPSASSSKKVKDFFTSPPSKSSQETSLPILTQQQEISEKAVDFQTNLDLTKDDKSKNL